MASRVGWLAGWGDGQGVVAGREGAAGRVGWRAGGRSGQVVGGGWIFGVKNVLE